MDDDLFESNIPNKIIDLTKEKGIRDGGPSINRGGRKESAHRSERERQFREMGRKAIAEGSLETLTDQEKQFGDNIIAGDAMVSSFEGAFPELCFKQEFHQETNEPYWGKPILTYHQIYTKAQRILKKPGLRLYITRGLDGEEEDISLTSQRLMNLQIKTLEEIARNGRTDTARLQAIKQLGDLRAIKAAEDKAGKRAERELAPDELIESIRDKLAKLASNK